MLLQRNDRGYSALSSWQKGVLISISAVSFFTSYICKGTSMQNPITRGLPVPSLNDKHWCSSLCGLNTHSGPTFVCVGG